MTILGPILAGLVLLAGVLWWCWPERCIGCGRRGWMRRMGDGLRHDIVCKRCGASQLIGGRSEYWRGD